MYTEQYYHRSIICSWGWPHFQGIIGPHARQLTKEFVREKTALSDFQGGGIFFLFFCMRVKTLINLLTLPLPT